MQKDFGKIGFILAALGSSIGLGHIWRFPTTAGMNGGGAFVLLFLGIALFVGVAMLVAEMLVGQQGRKNVPDSFKEITQNPKTSWRFVGITLFAGPFILTFYCAVLGWVLYYLVSVSFNLPADFAQSKAIFETFSSHTEQISYQILCFAIILAITAYSIVYGIKSIERLNYVLMPLLFIIFFGLLFYAMSLPSFGESVEFMFRPDFSKLTSNTIIDAMGQVFFSLSLGAGTIITYSSHVNRNQNLFASALWIVIPGIIISIVAGLMIFTFVFAYGSKADVAGGPGLIFIVLPVMFGHLGALGGFLCALFMIGLLFAGLSSTVSLLEPCIKYLTDKTKYSRATLTYMVSFGIFLVGIIVILSMNTNYQATLTFFEKNLFDWIDWISANMLLTWGSFFSSLFIGYFVSKDKLREWTKGYLKSDFAFYFWLYSLRVLAPLMVIVIFINRIQRF